MKGLFYSVPDNSCGAETSDVFWFVLLSIWPYLFFSFFFFSLFFSSSHPQMLSESLSYSQCSEVSVMCIYVIFFFSFLPIVLGPSSFSVVWSFSLELLSISLGKFFLNHLFNTFLLFSDFFMEFLLFRSQISQKNAVILFYLFVFLFFSLSLFLCFSLSLSFSLIVSCQFGGVSGGSTHKYIFITWYLIRSLIIMK